MAQNHSVFDESLVEMLSNKLQKHYNEQNKPRDSYIGSVTDAFKAGFANVYGGMADFADANLGVGRSVGDYFNEVAEHNSRKKEYDLPDMAPFASDYWTNPEGAAYTIGQTLGSSAAILPATAAIAYATPAGVAAGMAGLAARGLGKIGAGSLSRTMAGKTGETLARWTAGSTIGAIPESMSEGGNLYRKMTTGDTPFTDAQGVAAANEVTAKNIPLLMLGNAVQAVTLGKALMKPKPGDKLAKRLIKGALPPMGVNAAQEGITEFYQETYSGEAQGKKMGSLLDPSSWTREQRIAFGEGLIGGGFLSGAPATVRSVLPVKNNDQRTTPSEQTQNDADSIADESINDFLEYIRDTSQNYNLVNSIYETLESGNKQKIFDLARELGYRETVPAANINERIIPPLALPAPADVKALPAPAAVKALPGVDYEGQVLNGGGGVLLGTKDKAPVQGVTGKSVKVRTDDNVEFDARYKVVSADSLISSHNADHTVNNNYPAELQPRDRKRKGMRQQIAEIVNNLNPADLAEARSVNQGAPLVNGNNIVENGNGRTLALRRMYRGSHKNAPVYKQYLVDNAEKFGLDRAKIEAMPTPVLVRERISPDIDVNRIIASTEGGARLSAGEQARIDAGKFKTSTLELFTENDSGDLLSAANRDFTRAALRDIAKQNELNSLLDENGAISQTGVIKIRNALFAKAYEDNNLLAKMSESTDNNIRNITNALVNAAPYVAMTKTKMAEGKLYTYDLTKDVMNAVKKLMALRDEGKSVRVYLKEQFLFGAELSDNARNILQFLDSNKQKPKNISDLLKNASKTIQELGSPDQVNLFGDKKLLSLNEIYNKAMGSIINEGQQRIFAADRLQQSKQSNRSIPEGENLFNRKTTKESDKIFDEKRTKKALFERFGKKSLVGEKYSISDINTDTNTDTEKPGGKTPKEWITAIKKAFPTAERIERKGDTFTVNMPNGNALTINVNQEIRFTVEDRARAEYDLKRPLKPGELPAGTYRRVSDIGGIISLADIADAHTLNHEAYHAVRSLALTLTEQRLIDKYFKRNEEAQADGYAKWLQDREAYKGTVIRRFFQKIFDFVNKVKAAFGFDNVDNVFRKIAEGEVWNRETLNQNSSGFVNYNLMSDEELAKFLNKKVKIVELVDDPNMPDLQGGAKDLVKYIRDKYQGAQVVNKDTGNAVGFFREGLVASAKNRNPIARRLYAVLPQLIENAAYYDVRLNEKPEQRKHISHYETYYAAAKIDGLIHPVKIKLDIEKDGKRIRGYYYHQVKGIEIEVGDVAGNTSHGFLDHTTSPTSSTISISDLMGNSNKNSIGSKKSSPDVTDLKYSIRDATDNLIKNLGKFIGAQPAKNVKFKNNPNKERLTIIESIFRSPSAVAANHPAFKMFYEMATKASGVQEKMRDDFNHRLRKVRRLAEDAADKATLIEILWRGDMEGKNYTVQKLKNEGVKDNIIRAYVLIRSSIEKAYHALNDARKQVRTHSKNMNASELRDLKNNKFAEIVKIVPKENGDCLVTWKSPKTWEKNLIVNEQTMELYRHDDAIQILEANEIAKTNEFGELEKQYQVRVLESIPDIHKRGGYLPHFFHNYFIIGDGEVMGSGRTLADATKKANKFAEQNPNMQILISPKKFEFEGQDTYAAVVGDEEYRRMAEKITKDSEMTLAEAREYLSDKVKMKPRHRYFGNMLERKGAKGYEQENIDWILNHYFNSVSRYVALEEFKPRAISLFERYFGRYDKEHTGLAAYAKDYINDINGNPTILENILNEALKSSELFRNVLGKYFGDRPALQMSSMITSSMTVAKLGFLAPSSALLNLTQLLNAGGILGSPLAIVNGMNRAMNLTATDKKILLKSGVLNNISLDGSSGYSKFRPGKIGRWGLYFFKKMDMFARISTVLGAYYQGVNDKNMTSKEAINYAKEVNRDANFDYGVQDAPNIFRRGSVLAQVALQFQKYPIKEFELMWKLAKKGNIKQNAAFWLPYILIAGLFQFPFLELCNEFFKIFDADPKAACKEVLMDWAGKDGDKQTLAKLAMYGIGSTVGVDVSQRAGIADIVPTRIPKNWTEGVVKGIFGPAGSTAYDLVNKMAQGDPVGIVKAYSPALGNYLQSMLGEATTTRGRTRTRYDTGYDRVLHAIGFRSVDEAVASDIRSIINRGRDEKTKLEQSAIDAYINDPSPKNLAKLKELKITPQRVQNERLKKKMDNLERLKVGLSPKELLQYENTLNFAAGK